MYDMSDAPANVKRQWKVVRLMHVAQTNCVMKISSTWQMEFSWPNVAISVKNSLTILCHNVCNSTHLSTTFYGHTCVLLCLESNCGTDGVMFSAVWRGSPLVVTCDKLL